jgi:hypothetical protein
MLEYFLTMQHRIARMRVLFAAFVNVRVFGGSMPEHVKVS